MLCLFIILGIFDGINSLQTGYTCDTSVTLTCPRLRKLLILEVIYSSECPKNDKVLNGTVAYAPSRCIGYFRDVVKDSCNGKETCTIDNSIDERPSFTVGKQANCAFKGRSINIEYSCIPDFYSSKLPRIDICSLQLLDDIEEGFIHTPNYPNSYPDGLTCNKTVPAPGADHRLKIFILDFDVEDMTINPRTQTARIYDWLEINDNGEKLYGTRQSFTLLFDDVIEASLIFKSDSAQTKRTHNGFLLYFLVAGIGRSRPPSVTQAIKTTSILNDRSSDISMESKMAELRANNRRENNGTGWVLLVVLLSGILVVLVCAVLLYKRRHDRHVRYLREALYSLIPHQSRSVAVDSAIDNKDEAALTSSDDRSNLKYSDDKLETSYHIYSADPLEKNACLKTNDASSLVYESIDYANIIQYIDDNAKPH